jgi:hypothetical protein
MSAIWESANWTRQFGIRQTGNRQFGMLPVAHHYDKDYPHQILRFMSSNFVANKVVVCKQISNDDLYIELNEDQ